MRAILHGALVTKASVLKATPAWGYLQQMAHTLLYDAEAPGGNDRGLATDLLTASRSLCWQGAAPPPDRGLRRLPTLSPVRCPEADTSPLGGGFHDVPPAVLSPALAT